MKIYVDTEFTGLHKDTTLISIGLVSECGKTFYGECYDYDENQIDTWIQENVLNHTTYLSEIAKTECMSVSKENMYLVASKERLGEYLKEWFSQFDKVELVSDVCHYDMVLLIDLFGTAFDLPPQVSASCHDINQDIARYYGIDSIEAFDVSREDLLLNEFSVRIDGRKHNALYDARVIKAIDKFINK